MKLLKTRGKPKTKRRPDQAASSDILICPIGGFSARDCLILFALLTVKIGFFPRMLGDSSMHGSQGIFFERSTVEGKLSVAKKNRLSVLHCLLKDTPYSQRRLAELLHLRASTLSNITSELREAGLIEEGEVISLNRIGPPEHALRIRPDAAWGCGLEIDPRGLVLTLVNGRGDILATKHSPGHFQLEAMLDAIPHQVAALRRETGLGENRNGGLGISIPGIVNNLSGEVVFSQNFDLHNFPLREILQPSCPFPIWVDRNVIFGAYHDSIRTEGRQWENFAYFSARSPLGKGSRLTDYSLGMAFVIGNRFYRGFNHAAGELDHQIFPDLIKETGRADRPGHLTVPFREYSTRHLASVINLLDVGKLIVATDPDLLDADAFPAFEQRLREHLLPVSQRHFTVRLSLIGTAGVSIGAALHAMHRSLEKKLLTYMGKS